MEDKFGGLELNHILRHLNKVADALAKAASGQEPVQTGVFASDQYKPSVRYEEPEQAGDGPPTLGSGANQPSAAFDPKSWSLTRIQRQSLTLWQLDDALPRLPPP